MPSRVRFVLFLAYLSVTACATIGTGAGSGDAAANDSVATRRALAGMRNGAWESTYAPLPSRPTLIRGATVMTATGEEIAGADVLMVDGKIAGVGPGLAAPAGALEIDGTGRFVTPGIIDTHSRWCVVLAGTGVSHAYGCGRRSAETFEIVARAIVVQAGADGGPALEVRVSADG